MKPRVSNISSLTPLRGIAALGVAVFHFQIYFVRFLQKDQSMLIDKLYLMVDLFFIMSGFLIMHVYKDDFAERISKISFRKFIVARFARVYPLHFITLVMLVLLFYVESLRPRGFYEPDAIASHIFLLQSFPLNKELTWNVPSWSISAEWWSYMLFPLICLFLSRKKKLAIPLMLLVIVAAYTAILFYIPRTDVTPEEAKTMRPNLDVNFDYGFLRSIAGFMSGMLLYLLYSYDAVKKFFSSDIFCAVFILLLLAAMHFGVDDIYFIPGFAVLILLLTSNTGKITTVFNNRVLNFLGDISYSVYLVHFLLIIFIEMVMYKFGYRFHGEIDLSFFKGAAYCAGYVLLLIGISTLSYRIIEKPCRKYFNKKWAGK
ncbi:acyltransferase family protein [Ferruginibacter sp.]